MLGLQFGTGPRLVAEDGGRSVQVRYFKDLAAREADAVTRLEHPSP